MSDANVAASGGFQGPEIEAQPYTLRKVLYAIFDIGFITVSALFTVLALVSANSVTLLAKAEVGGISNTSIMVTSIPAFANGLEFGLNSHSISSTDVAALSSPGAIPAATFVAPVSLSTVSVRYAYRQIATVAIGTTPSYLPPSGYKLEDGEFLSNSDEILNRDVAVIGSSVKSALFGPNNPIGQTIVVGGHRFRVIGVLASRGFAAALDMDNVVIIPQSTVGAAIGGIAGVSQVLIGTRTPALAEQAAQQAQAELLSLHQIADPAEANFTILNHDAFVTTQLSELRTLKRTMTLFSLVLSIAASVHLARTYTRRRDAGGSHFSTDSPQIFDLFRILMVGIIGGLVGLGLGIVVTPFLRVLAPGAQILGSLSLSGAGFVLFVAVCFAVVSLFPAAVGLGRQNSRGVRQ